jgi:hypothetical protein
MTELRDPALDLIGLFAIRRNFAPHGCGIISQILYKTGAWATLTQPSLNRPYDLLNRASYSPG